MEEIKLNRYYIDKKSEETILYLHGWNASYQTLLCLKQDDLKFNELFFDLPGCGQSKEPTHPLKIDDYIDMICKNCEEQLSKITYIIGHSFGGKLAVKLAKHFPNLKGLFLISPSIVKPTRGLKYYFKVWQYKLFKKLHLNTSKMGSVDFQNATPVMKKTLVNVVNEDGVEEIKEILLPTLLIWAKEDQATPLKMAYKIKKLMYDCEIIKIEGNHFGYLLKQNNVSIILKNFILEVNKHDRR